MIYDVFTYNGETKILQLHLATLYNHVDRFIIVEANKTFTGKEKPLYFFRDQRFFKPWWKKIDYYVMNMWDDSRIWKMALQSPLTTGAEHWKREFYIKESIQKALLYYKVRDDDTVFIGDVDEILDPNENLSDMPMKAKLRVYAYYLNNRSDEEFWGTIVVKYGDIKDKCLNEVRNDTSLRTDDYKGWHFTSMGGLDEVYRKLNDSYTHETYNVSVIPGHVERCLAERTDILNRPFTFTLDETAWPSYLTENRRKYQHLCK